MKYFCKSSILIICLIIALSLTTAKPAVAAGMATFETNPYLWVYNIITSTASQLISKAASGALTQAIYEWTFKQATAVLKKQLFDMMVDQIVNWIQGGGNPKFITNWPAFFRDAVDQAGGKFINDFALKNGVNLCSPFKSILGAGFIPIPTFTERTACTLTAIGVNLDAFLKDFRQGGWIAWQEMVLRPQNNIYGAYALAWDQYEIEKTAAAKAAEAEAQAGKGFLSAKKCLETGVPVDAQNDCQQGYSIQQNACSSQQQNPSAYTACMNAATQAMQSCLASARVCTKEQTITPGAVVGDLASKALNSNLDFLLTSEDLSAYVAAITNAILNRVFAEGVGLLHTALSGNTSSSSGGGGAVGGNSTTQVQCSQLLGTAAYNACINALQGGQDIGGFQKNYLISSIEQDLSYQSQLLGAKQTTLIILNQSVDILNQLKNCSSTTPPALAQVQGSASITATQIAKIQSDIVALQVKQQQINTATSASQIASLWAEVSKVVDPATTYNLALSAQDETIQKQQDMNSYQQQLNSCQNSNY